MTGLVTIGQKRWILSVRKAAKIQLFDWLWQYHHNPAVLHFAIWAMVFLLDHLTKTYFSFFVFTSTSTDTNCWQHRKNTAWKSHPFPVQLTPQFPILSFLMVVLGKSLVTCSVERKWIWVGISYPTNAKHVCHITFNRFNGFLSLLVELLLEVPRKVPSARLMIIQSAYFWVCFEIHMGLISIEALD